MTSLKYFFGYSAAVALAGLSLTGNAQPLVGVTPSSTAGFATLHIYRATGGSGAPQVVVNSKVAGRLGESGYLHQVTSAGPVALEISSSAGPVDALAGTRGAVTLAAGQSSFWRLDIRPASAAGEPPQAVMVEVPAARAREEIRLIAR